MGLNTVCDVAGPSTVSRLLETSTVEYREKKNGSQLEVIIECRCGKWTGPCPVTFGETETVVSHHDPGLLDVYLVYRWTFFTVGGHPTADG